MAKSKVTVNFKPIKHKVLKFRQIARGRIGDVYKKGIEVSIRKGISPVKGGGRYKKYSKSYRAAIKGNLAFRVSKHSGKVFVIDNKDKVEDMNAHLKGKKVSPVNLKVSGELMKSLKVETVVSRGNVKIKISFDNPLADIHNRQGAGKSKVVRRMLPTETGETFNRSITKKVREVLTNIAKQIFKG